MTNFLQISVLDLKTAYKFLNRICSAGFSWKSIPYLLTALLLVFAISAQASTVYEDAEDGLTDGWAITDNIPSGASVTNVYDPLLGSNVIALSGEDWVTRNAFLIGGFNGPGAWNNTNEFILSFRLRSSERYIINVRLATNKGVRYVRYKNTNVTGNLIGNTIDIGLGDNTDDDTWYHFTRDLQADLSAGEPDAVITAVNGILVRGHVRLDDISLTDSSSTANVPPVANAGADLTFTVGELQILDGAVSDDSDGSISTYEWRLDGTTAVIASGSNPTLSPALAEGSYTIELTVTDNEGASSTDTVSVTIKPTSNTTGTITIYEDAEDGLVDGWSITDNNPSGASVTNVFDSLLGSNVIDLSGIGSETSNAFLIGDYNGPGAWNNTNEFILSFRLRADERYNINVRLATNKGVRYVRYRNTNVSGTVSGNTIDVGLGDNTDNDTWFSFTRDLQADLSAGESDAVISAVNGILVRGHLRLDDISLANLEQSAVSNVPPVADAGANLTVTVGEPQILDGSASDDTDGSIVTHEWRLDGIAAVIATGANPTLAPPLPEGTHTVELMVIDDDSAASTDTVTLNIMADGLNVPPVADAGADLTFTVGEPQILDGSASDDSDGSISTYEWRLDGTTTVIATGVSPTLNPPLAEGIYTLELIVTDDQNATSIDKTTLNVIASTANVPPVADAGADRSFTVGQQQVLDGSASKDSDGTIIAYEWRLDGTTTVIATGVNPTLSPALEEGVYTIELVVTDNDLVSTTDTFQLSIQVADGTFDPNDSSNRYVDGNAGSDSGDGSLSNPWGTIDHALRQLVLGDTLVIRAGTYKEQNLALEINGSADQITTIRSYPGELVVIDASDDRLRESDQSLWELFDNATSTYRTRENNFGSDMYAGSATTQSGANIPLIPYIDDASSSASGLSDLMSTTYHVSPDPRYVGPGIYNDAGRIYLRLSHVPENLTHGIATASVTTTNPDDYNFNLSDRSQVLGVTGSYILLKGLSFTGAISGLKIQEDSHHIEIVDSIFSVPAVAIILQDGADNITIDGVTVNGDFPRWLAWTDMKGQDGQSTPASHWVMRSTGLSGNFVSDIIVRNSQFNDVFDGMVISGSNVEISHNQGEFVDDFIQLGSNSDNVNIHNNTVFGAGPSHYGRGDSDEPGTIYVHHNLIDSRTKFLRGKSDPNGILDLEHRGWRSQAPFSAHRSSGLDNGDPWKIYYNTILFDGLDSDNGSGINLWAKLNNTGVAHEVYNNVLVEVGGGTMLTDVSINAGPQIYDGNLFWQPVSNATQQIFSDFRDDNNKKLGFDSVEHFKSSDMYEQSKQIYAPGWSNSSYSGDPNLDSSFRPIQGGVAASGAVPIPSSFPGNTHNYRGALAPNSVPQ